MCGGIAWERGNKRIFTRKFSRAKTFVLLPNANLADLDSISCLHENFVDNHKIFSFFSGYCVVSHKNVYFLSDKMFSSSPRAHFLVWYLGMRNMHFDMQPSLYLFSPSIKSSSHPLPNTFLVILPSFFNQTLNNSSRLGANPSLLVHQLLLYHYLASGADRPHSTPLANLQKSGNSSILH